MAISARQSGLLGIVGGLAVSAVLLAAVLAPMRHASAAPPLKPGAGNLIERIGGKPTPYNGTDSCTYAHDLVCDEPGLGTGACSAGTDYSDCFRLAIGREDDSCQWANDHVCDEPTIGTNNCTQGSDRTDCASVAAFRFQTDICATAFDGVCNVPGVGDGTCEPRTDRADCVTRDRPLELEDHFHGHDDRQLLDTAVFPWSVIGRLVDPFGGQCTATLIAEDILVTAAHCIEFDDGIDARSDFLTGDNLPGGELSAHIVSYFVSPDHVVRKGVDLNDTEWLLMRIDRPLGRELGFIPSRALDDRTALQWEVRQAGYGWDHGNNLAGHLGCRILEIEDEHTIEHDCDTTVGDSGSPLLAFIDGAYSVIAVDSRYGEEDGISTALAARSNEWIGYFDDFQAGRIGTAVPLIAGSKRTPLAQK